MTTFMRKEMLILYINSLVCASVCLGHRQELGTDWARVGWAWAGWTRHEWARHKHGHMRDWARARA
jgi:hypothetical protein